MTDLRRRREHNVRAAYRAFDWYELAHRHRRRNWRKALKRLRGKVIS